MTDLDRRHEQELAPAGEGRIGGLGVVRRTAVVVGNGVDERAGGVAYLCGPQIRRSRDSMVYVTSIPRWAATPQPFLAADGLGGQGDRGSFHAWHSSCSGTLLSHSP